ncbi:MAG TPA: class I SAM-dependent methyltransferase [Bryobacteraceae bacterium]|jgi:ubiquinone/menaquinone biosynthesis C-methylase UbiE
MLSNPWQAGDFAKIAPSAMIVSEVLCDAVPIYAGERVLDIGCGSGNTATAAARRRAVVTGVDPVEKLLAAAQARAAFENLEIDWHHGSAEDLPFADAAFDVALSTYGMIFSTDPSKAVAEAARVLVPGGRLALTSWTEHGMIDEFFAALEDVMPDMAMIPVARAWGRQDDARARLASHFSEIRMIERTVYMRAPDMARWLAGMKKFLGPFVLAYESLSPEGANALDERILGLSNLSPKASNGSFFAEVPYLEIHGIRAASI